MVCSVAAVAGLVSALWGAPSAGAIPPPITPPGQGAPKLEGQLKNGFNHLCMDDGKELHSAHAPKLGRPVTFQKCRTVNGGYTSASQYFFLEGRYGGFQLHTLWSNICIGRRLGGYPASGDDLENVKCDASSARQLFQYVGGAEGVPFYFYAKYYDSKHREYHSTPFTVGVRTRSVNEDVGINKSGRVSYTAWHGTLEGTR